MFGRFPWTFRCTHTFIGPGPWPATATATGIDTVDGLPAPLETAATAVTVSCNHNITGMVPTALILGRGSWCIIDANIAGAIVIQRGAAVFIGHSILHGAISSNGAASFAMCAATAQAGSNNLRNGTGFVVIGDPTSAADDGCAGNSVRGSLNLSDNHGGAEVIDDTIGGALSVFGTTGTGPFPEDSTVEIEGNTVAGALECDPTSLRRPTRATPTRRRPSPPGNAPPDSEGPRLRYLQGSERC